jgi:hypothetical protein
MSMAASPQSSSCFTGAAAVLGVVSCGKTYVGEAPASTLAAHFHADFTTKQSIIVEIVEQARSFLSKGM